MTLHYEFVPVFSGWWIKKDYYQHQNKIIPRGSTKNSYEDQKKLFTWIETLSCGREVKIGSLTGSKKIIRVGAPARGVFAVKLWESREHKKCWRYSV